MPTRQIGIIAGTVAACVFTLGELPRALACPVEPSSVIRGELSVEDWRADGQQSYFEDRQLVLKAGANNVVKLTNEKYRFASGTFCLDVKAPQEPVAAGAATAGGLVFWSSDSRQYFLAEVFPDATFGIYRMAGRWSDLAPRQKFAALHSAPGAINEIGVKTVGNHFRLYLNDTLAFEGAAQMPLMGGTVGVFAMSADSPSEWRFTAMTATSTRDFTGRYSVAGTVSDGSSYQGTVIVEKDNETFKVKRSVAGVTTEGLGLAEFDRVAVAYPPVAGKASVGQYAPTENGWAGVIATPLAPTPKGALVEVLANETWTQK